MTQIEDLHTPHEGVEFPIEFRCRHCAFFRGSGTYKVNGVVTPCSKPAIGRAEDDAPCVRFAHDTKDAIKVPLAVRKQMRKLLRLIDDEVQYKKDKADASMILIRMLIASMEMRRRGIDMGSRAKLDSGETGYVMYMRPRSAVVENDGVFYHVHPDTLTYLPKKKKSKAKKPSKKSKKTKSKR